MYSRLACFLLTVPLAALLAGCPAVELRDANDQLTSYYLAKEQAEETENWQMLESSVASLEALSVDAAARARAEDNRLNRISLYRIAATAAWQAGATEVVAYGRAGQELCDAETFARAPRDCGMLMVIPTLAGVDETTARLEALQAEIDAVGDDNATDSMRDRAGQAYDDYVAALATLLSRRAEILASDAHPLFKEQLDNNIGVLLCGNLVGNVRGLVVNIDSPRRGEIAAGINRCGCATLAAGVAPAKVPCVRQDCAAVTGICGTSGP